MKTCITCGIEKEDDEFNRCGDGKRRSECRSCLSNRRKTPEGRRKAAEYQKRWYKKNRERWAKYQHEYFEKNKKRFREYSRRYYYKYPEKAKARYQQARIRRREAWIKVFKEVFGFPFVCNQCGYTDENFIAFDCHHIEPKEKEIGISQLSMSTLPSKEKIAELKKTQLLCAICHRKTHYI